MQIFTTATPLTNQDQEGCRLKKYYKVWNIIRLKHDEWGKKLRERKRAEIKIDLD